jgi:hypothetical protein
MPTVLLEMHGVEMVVRLDNKLSVVLMVSVLMPALTTSWEQLVTTLAQPLHPIVMLMELVCFVHQIPVVQLWMDLLQPITRISFVEVMVSV